MASIECSSSGSMCPGIVAALHQRQFEEVWAQGITWSTTQDSVLRLTPEFDIDDFHVGALLGQGSFSTAQRVSLKTKKHETNEYECMYALKRLKSNVVADTNSCAIASADLAVETSILKKLKHENIIAVHGVKSGDIMESLKNGTYFIVLDLLHMTLDGRMLKWRQEQRRSLFNTNSRKQISEKLKHTALGITNGMAYLHSKRIILRDLKPANVGFDYDNDRVKIFDFGLARAVISRDTHVRETPLRLMTMCVGTPRYMAPEVFCEGRAYGYPVDVYSYGILLWEIVTNRRAFSKLSSLKDFADKVNKGNKRPNLKYIESSSLKALLESAWSSDPAIRPSFEFIGQALKNHITVRYEYDLIDKGAKTRVRSTSDISRSLLDRTYSTSSMSDDSERWCESVGHSSTSRSRGSLSMPPFCWNRSSYATGWSGGGMSKTKGHVPKAT